MPRLTTKNRDAALFGAIFQRLRMARGWSLVIAARRAGMNANYLGTLEKGSNMPSMETLFELAELYGLAASEIVAEVEKARRAAG
jgi:transcriptional regulator with XRE-family HTH domain